MEINFVLGMLILLIIYIVLTSYFMKIASFIGEQLKIGTFFISLLNKQRKYK